MHGNVPRHILRHLILVEYVDFILPPAVAPASGERQQAGALYLCACGSADQSIGLRSLSFMRSSSKHISDWLIYSSQITIMHRAPLSYVPQRRSVTGSVKREGLHGLESPWIPVY